MDKVYCFILTFIAIAPSIFALHSYERSQLQLQISFDSSTKHKNLQERSIPQIIRESCVNNLDIPSTRVNTNDRLRRLRLRMKASSYDAYIIPSSDEHQSEFVADHDTRRQFISGFSGSAGTAVVLQESAALWTDGRYFLQAEAELDCNWLLMKQNQKGVPSLDEWIVQTLKHNSNIGADSKLIPYNKWMKLKEKFANFNITIHADWSNLIDDIWSIPQGRVPESVSHIFIHDVKYAGKTWQDKIKDVLGKINENGANGTIITALDEIAWLFNLRGHDSGYTPVFKAYALITATNLRLYVKKLKVTTEIEKHLCPKSSQTAECVEIVDYKNAFTDMKKIIEMSEKILVSSSSSFAVVDLVPEEKRTLLDGPSPVAKLKVVKNSVEVTGMKNAALKDSVAIVDFISMLEEEVKKGKHWDEIKASRTLKKYREEQELNQGESFETISAFGANGAIIHYRPQISTNRNINNKHLYLLDSGGQYLDGTTDITRTFHFGEPDEFEMEAYTRVLMGVIDLITTIFPDGVQGVELDILARRALYSAGLNYLHGTGHGIGSFLGVHEGPIGIRIPSQSASYPLKPGMFLSNEPGFYAADKFGIRLETMMMVVNAYTPHKFNNKEHYTFEPVSFVPFEPKLMDLSLLNKKQKEWLNWFNMKTRNTVGLELKKQHRMRGFHWLLSKTEYIPVENQNCVISSVCSNYISLNLIASLIFCYILFTGKMFVVS